MESPLHVRNDRPRTQSARGLCSANGARPSHMTRAANAQGRKTFPFTRGQALGVRNMVSAPIARGRFDCHTGDGPDLGDTPEPEPFALTDG